MDLIDIYGSCRAEPCSCRVMTWLGRHCHNWHPMGVSTVPELEAWHRAASTDGRAPYKPETSTEGGK